MKIAAVTNDGDTISVHFGRARSFAVLTVEDGAIVSRERRERTAQPGGNAHTSAAAQLADCDAVLSRGMGQGMYASLQQAGLRVVLTRLHAVDEAVLAYAAGTLEDHPDLVN